MAKATYLRVPTIANGARWHLFVRVEAGDRWSHAVGRFFNRWFPDRSVVRDRKRGYAYLTATPTNAEMCDYMSFVKQVWFEDFAWGSILGKLTDLGPDRLNLQINDRMPLTENEAVELFRRLVPRTAAVLPGDLDYLVQQDQVVVLRTTPMACLVLILEDGQFWFAILTKNTEVT